MAKQTTRSVLMIEPVAFSYNAETAVNNYFQHQPLLSENTIQPAALAEFRTMVDQLLNEGITVQVIRDTLQPRTPDSIFPNNWVSFHENGSAVLYPMFAENRRSERRTDLFSILNKLGQRYTEILDLSSFEHQQLYLEGTGSMVLDRRNKIAYAALSSRTNGEVLLVFCKNTGYQPVSFHALQQVGDERLPVYHTNVMMCVAEQFAVVCLESIDDEREKEKVVRQLQKNKKEIVAIREAQMHQFAGNMLQLRTQRGELKLVLSASAFHSLSEQQVHQLQQYNKLIVCNVPTIEKYGGGSVRCMIAELF